ncbi:Cj0814 family flagellar-dependent secreted protein [Campylobacter sp.]|uniref:Cj0814 family flagellar-dependent secreted protein n=1 Tax=Campylobacter sp. TaxID=205 RepID=UPI002AA8D22F|nr:hypothetical protein [Campylobacter sp.]MCI7581338.1 hypothetical protein [Campylobacter sp.]
MLVMQSNNFTSWNSSFNKQKQANSRETFNLEFPAEIEIQSDIKTAKKLEIGGIEYLEYLEFPSSNAEINSAMNPALSPATAVNSALSQTTAVGQTTTTTATAYGYSVDSKGFMGADFNKAAGLPAEFKIHKSTLDWLNNALLKSSSYLMENNDKYLQSIDIAQNVKAYYNIFAQIVPQKDSFNSDDLKSLPKGYSSTGARLNNLTILFDRSNEKVTNIFKSDVEAQKAQEMQFKLLGVGVEFVTNKLDFSAKKLNENYKNDSDHYEIGAIFGAFLRSLDEQGNLSPVEQGSILTAQASSYRNQMGVIKQPSFYSLLDIASGKASIETLIKEKIAENIEFRQKHGEKNKELINALIKDNLWYDESTDISKVADELKDELTDVIRHSFIA